MNAEQDLPAGLIGLGNMGRPMATNLLAAGHRLVVYDAAGTEERSPQGAEPVGSSAEVARRCGLVLLSLPEGSAVLAVAEELAGAGSPGLRTVVDTSTIGMDCSRRVHERLSRAGIEYLDAPVSGGVAGARSATLAMMCAGSRETIDNLRPLLGSIVQHIFHVGEAAGQAQAMKLLNNFLAATGIAASSEAFAFGEQAGLDLKTMVDVVNVSTGRNMATLDKFPNRVLTGTYDAGFTNRLLLKDVLLYQAAAREVGTPVPVGAPVAEVWQRFEDAAPGSDITRMFPFLRGLQQTEED